MTHWTRTTLVSMISLAFTGCALEDMEDVEYGDEDIGSIASALCTDGGPNATAAFKDRGGFSGATSALPTNSYDHPDCSDRFTVEITGVSAATQPFSVGAGWGEALPNTEAACELALANVQTHEYTMVDINCGGQLCLPVYGWQQVGPEITLRGEWLPFFGSHYCALVPDSPLPKFQPNFFRKKVRVAVRAYAWALFFPSYKRGEAGVVSPEVPR